MASLNDYKLLHQKCITLFESASSQMAFDIEKLAALDNMTKARFGFYYIILQSLTPLDEFDDITDAICDQDFNAKLFGAIGQDEGIDASFVDGDSHTIYIFNFKYRKYKEDQEQSINEFVASSKFFSAIKSNNTSQLSGRIKVIADDILSKFDSNEIWDVVFFYVSNEGKALSSSVGNVKTISEEYGFEFRGVGLDEIVNLLSLHPRNLNAKFVVPTQSVLTYEEDQLSSEKSYVIRMNLAELIRITCNDENKRNLPTIEDEKELSHVDIDMDVLFDNVRGLVVRSKFNNGILKSLDDEPTKIFYYNNGLTIVADDIVSREASMNTRREFQINNLQVINGGQTLRTIHMFNLKDENNLVKLAKAQVLVRFLKVGDERLKNKIAEYTNSQNAISISDLKSLRAEQIQLEEFLATKNIQYFRKKGELRANNSFSYSIGKERFGQVLLSTKFERPEYASNKKREIFDTYYDTIFTLNTGLISNESVKFVNMYQESEKAYKASNKSAKVQKNLYICYIAHKTGRSDYVNIVNEFEQLHSSELSSNSSIRMSSNAFREAVDRKFGITNSASF